MIVCNLPDQPHKKGSNMKNIMRILWIITVLTAVVGFGLISCSDGDSNGGSNGVGGGNGSGTGGMFTLTDIPSKYNGKYLIVQGGTNTLVVGGAQNYNPSNKTSTLVQITDGKASLPMWSGDIETFEYYGLNRYFGNDTIDLEVGISNVQTSVMYENSGIWIAVGYFYSVTFINGGAAMSFNNLQNFMEL